jgi:hypothetical protein
MARARPKVLSHVHLTPLCITAWAPLSVSFRGGVHVFKQTPLFKRMCRMSYYLRSHAINTTFNNGSLGSRIDEERSEMRYVM